VGVLDTGDGDVLAGGPAERRSRPRWITLVAVAVVVLLATGAWLWRHDVRQQLLAAAVVDRLTADTTAFGGGPARPSQFMSVTFHNGSGQPLTLLAVGGDLDGARLQAIDVLDAAAPPKEERAVRRSSPPIQLVHPLVVRPGATAEVDFEYVITDCHSAARAPGTIPVLARARGREVHTSVRPSGTPQGWGWLGMAIRC
jgi:hypothetical protein